MTAQELVTVLKAAAEPTRLRVLLLLSCGEFNVKDLTRILGQSQPRISRHLKLLAEAGLIGRTREGSWAYFRLTDDTRHGWLGRLLSEAIDPLEAVIARDLARAEALKRERGEAALAFFREHAGRWDGIRSLHVDEAEVEAAMAAALGRGPFDVLVDLGTGTGRILELFSARFSRAIGIDASPAMLSYARAKLDRAPLQNVQLRQGDICNLSVDDGSASVVVMHQVLHYVIDPMRAIGEAARILVPGGRLLLIDFAPHELEFLRDEFAHVRLGFGRSEMAQWFADSGLATTSVIDLVPPAPRGGDKLTVSLWVGTRVGATDRAARGAVVRPTAVDNRGGKIAAEEDAT